MKTNSRLASFRTLALAVILSGCIESPILKHSNADSGPRSPLGQTDSSCPLAFPQAGLCASLAWETMPSDETKGSFLLRFWNAKDGNENGPYVAPTNTVFVKLWMPSMGHGSSPVKVEAVLDSGRQPVPGVFRASEVFFVMGGSWEIWTQLRQDREVREQAKIDFEI